MERGLARWHVRSLSLAWMNKRETQQVVRPGKGGLGRWNNKSPPVLADNKNAIGNEPPDRIAGIWLIAAAAFQSVLGECEYKGIELKTKERTIAVGP